MPPKKNKLSDLWIADFSIAVDGQLSLLIGQSTDAPVGDAPNLLLKRSDRSSSMRPVHFVRKVGLHFQYRAELLEAQATQVVREDATDQALPFAAVRHSNKAGRGLVARVRGLFSGRAQAKDFTLLFRPDPTHQTLDIRTYHDSFVLEDLTGDARPFALRRRKDNAVLPGRLNSTGGYLFSNKELLAGPETLSNGSSLWDVVRLGSAPERVKFVGAPGIDARQQFSFSWCWAANPRELAKARPYWSKDGHLAVKISKKEL